MYVYEAVRKVAHELGLTKAEAANWLLVHDAHRSLHTISMLESGETAVLIDPDISLVSEAHDYLVELADCLPSSSVQTITAGPYTGDVVAPHTTLWWEEGEFKQFLELRRNPAIPSSAGAINVRQWPWGSHHTEALGHLEAAARRYWTIYEPDDATTANTNATVSEWLQKERGVSKTMADSIASILRADGLPTGPRK